MNRSENPPLSPFSKGGCYCETQYHQGPLLTDINSVAPQKARIMDKTARSCPDSGFFILRHIQGTWLTRKVTVSPTIQSSLHPVRVAPEMYGHGNFKKKGGIGRVVKAFTCNKDLKYRISSEPQVRKQHIRCTRPSEQSQNPG